jgi:hypothetical protein
MADRQKGRDRDRQRDRDPGRERKRQPARAGGADEPAPEEWQGQSRIGGQADWLSAGPAAEAGLRQIAALTGKTPEGVTGVEPTEDGWLVSVEVLEDHRVPSSSDILALYEAELDPDGSLLAYRRTRRYSRNHATDEREASQ